MDIQKERKAFLEHWYENNLHFDDEDKFQKPAWDAWQAAKAQAMPEGFVLVPRVITDEWMTTFIDQTVSDYCKDFEDSPFHVRESELPEVKENHRLKIRNAHKQLIQVIEAQEQGHD